MLAHPVERVVRNHEVSGSSPLHSTKLVIKNPPEKKLSGIFVFLLLRAHPGALFLFFFCERVIYICSAPCAPALVDSSTSILVLSNKIRCDFSISIFTCKFSCYVIDSFTTEMLSRYGYTYQRLGRLSGK